MRKARIENNKVMEIIDANPFPPFHLNLKWAECDLTVKPGWSYDGSVFSPPSDTDPERLAHAKRVKINHAKHEAIRRIQLQVPEWETHDEIRLLASIWNMLGTPNAAQTNAKNIYVYVKNTVIPDINSRTSVSDIENINVETDYAWPV